MSRRTGPLMRPSPPLVDFPPWRADGLAWLHAIAALPPGECARAIEALTVPAQTAEECDPLFAWWVRDRIETLCWLRGLARPARHRLEAIALAARRVAVAPSGGHSASTAPSATTQEPTT